MSYFFFIKNRFIKSDFPLYSVMDHVYYVIVHVYYEYKRYSVSS